MDRNMVASQLVGDFLIPVQRFWKQHLFLEEIVHQFLFRVTQNIEWQWACNFQSKGSGPVIYIRISCQVGPRSRASEHPVPRGDTFVRMRLHLRRVLLERLLSLEKISSLKSIRQFFFEQLHQSTARNETVEQDCVSALESAALTVSRLPPSPIARSSFAKP